MRNYLNSTVYDALPQELKDRIIDTPVVSGHGSSQSDNFYSSDKIYLLSSKEVWGSSGERYDSASNLTRQLDYYHDIGVTTELSNSSGAIKQYNGSYSKWWLRSANPNNSGDFFYVDEAGSWLYSGCLSKLGVSPAFRIG